MYDKLLLEYIKFIAIWVVVFMIVIGTTVNVVKKNSINAESETTVIETGGSFTMGEYYT